MTTSTSRSFLLKVGEGEPMIYRTAGGFRVVSEAISASGVLVTAVGIFMDHLSEGKIRANMEAGTSDNYELSFDDGEKLRGRFLVQKLDYAGDFIGERNYTITLSGQGASQ